MTAEWSQPELVAANGRRFAGFAAAVLVFIIDPSTRRFLRLAARRQSGGARVGRSSMEASKAARH